MQAGLSVQYSQATAVPATQCSWTVRQREVQLASALLMCDSTRGHIEAANVHAVTLSMHLQLVCLPMFPIILDPNTVEVTSTMSTQRQSSLFKLVILTVLELI